MTTKTMAAEVAIVSAYTTEMACITLTPRQQRELEYHREHAAACAEEVLRPVADDIVVSTSRRPWNAYWSMYDRLRACDLVGRKVLVIGCGFGDDAIRLARMGAQVTACDLSPDSLDIARKRAQRSGVAIDFSAMPAEAMTYADDSFDAIIFVDILHHVDIAATMSEVARVLKPGARVIGDELYTHTSLQRIRESRAVQGVLYPLMRRWIYGNETPYITADEHKIDEREFALVTARLTDVETDWFNIVEGRLYPSHLIWASRIERAVTRPLAPLAPVLAGRVVFSGRLAKPAR
jgi:2-polyprenyl-3-methyl-5-hydroxy-6-metoxy-1,4-benzoquinol methylase